MKKYFLFLFCLSVLLACSTAQKDAERPTANKAENSDIYSKILQIAEELPMNTKHAQNFFENLDGVNVKPKRKGQKLRFHYKAFTVLYNQPENKALLKSISLNLDTINPVSMHELEEKLNIVWHSVDLIDIKGGKMYYSTEYVDSKNIKKYIYVATGLSYLPHEKKNHVTFIKINCDRK